MPEKDDFDLRFFMPYLLNQAAEEASVAFQSHYKNRYGMLRTEWRVLFHLGIYGRLTARDISEKARINKTKISRAVHRLNERRFLTRERDALDRRSEHLELTAKGRAAYEDLHEVARAYDAELLAAFSPEEARSLRNMLSAIARGEGGSAR